MVKYTLNQQYIFPSCHQVKHPIQQDKYTWDTYQVRGYPSTLGYGGITIPRYRERGACLDTRPGVGVIGKDLERSDIHTRKIIDIPERLWILWKYSKTKKATWVAYFQGDFLISNKPMCSLVVSLVQQKTKMPV